MQSGVFLTNFEWFGNVAKHCLESLIYNVPLNSCSELLVHCKTKQKAERQNYKKSMLRSDIETSSELWYLV